MGLLTTEYTEYKQRTSYVCIITFIKWNRQNDESLMEKQTAF